MAIPYQPGGPLTCAQARAIDAYAIESLGVPGIVLMENAGRSAAEIVYAELRDPLRDPVLILCGPGNNGGDGFVIARHLSNAGMQVSVVLSSPSERSTGDAATNLRIYERLGGLLLDASSPVALPHVHALVARAGVIVDALLGTGSSGPPHGTIAELIRLANTAPQARRIAIDIPSGLDADRGIAADPCFRADITVTFVAAKIGFSTPAARDVLGRFEVTGIGISRESPGAEKN